MKTNLRNNSSENYVTNADETTATLEKWVLNENQNLEFIANEHNILLVISGNFSCSFQEYIDEDIGKSQMIFISMGTRCYIKTNDEALILCLKPGLILNISNLFLYNNKHEEVISKMRKGRPFLNFTPLVEAYTESLMIFLELGFNDPIHMYLKTRELFHLMSVSYSLDQRSSFFHALASKDKAFSDFIYKNYRQVESIRELAALYCLSLSGFEKRFRKVFGVSALHWIALRRAADIYQEIKSNHKSIKQISSDYGFSSVSHFHKFCKAKLGLSPGHMRRQAQGL
ncbi:MAG: helix-turn-helix domain-containing protein [Dysgonomonas sp.]